MPVPETMIFMDQSGTHHPWEQTRTPHLELLSKQGRSWTITRIVFLIVHLIIASVQIQFIGRVPIEQPPVDVATSDAHGKHTKSIQRMLSPSGNLGVKSIMPILQDPSGT